MADAFNRIQSSQQQLDRTGLERLIWEGTQAIRAFANSCTKKTSNTQDSNGNTVKQRFSSLNQLWSVIPQEPEEDQKDYKNRILRSYLVEFFKKAVTSDAGKVFADGVKISSDTESNQAKADEFIEDIDLEGTDADSFFVDIFEFAEAFACVGILIQFRNPSGSALLSDQKAAGARPYAAKITSEQLLGWEFDDIRKTGEPTPGLSAIRIAQSKIEYVDFEEKIIEQVLEIRRDQINIYEEGNDTPIQTGTNSLGFVPFVECNLNRISFMQGQAPYRGLADLNNQYLNVSSDLSNIIHYAMVPFLHIADGDDDDGEGEDFRLAGNTVLHTGPEAKVAWVEIEGKSIEEGQKELSRIEQSINTIGLDLLNFTERTTATGEKIDNQNNNSALKTLVPIIEDTIVSTMNTMMVLANNSIKVTVELNKDFDEVDDQKDGELINKLGENKTISKKMVTESAAINRILPETYDFDADQKQIAVESAEATKQLAATPAGLDDDQNT